MPDTLSLPIRLAALGVGVALWVAQYFLINRMKRPLRARIRTDSRLDAFLPFAPGFMVVYLTTYLFGVLPPLMVNETTLFFRLGVVYATTTLIAATIHVVWPSEIVRAELRGDPRFSARLITWFQRLCKPYGNFPSIHVAFSVVTVLTGYLVAGPLVGSLLLVWALLIAVSTLVTRQHYLLDVVAGGALGGGVAAAAFFLV